MFWSEWHYNCLHAYTALIVHRTKIKYIQIDRHFKLYEKKNIQKKQWGEVYLFFSSANIQWSFFKRKAQEFVFFLVTLVVMECFFKVIIIHRSHLGLIFASSQRHLKLQFLHDKGIFRRYYEVVKKSDFLLVTIFLTEHSPAVNFALFLSPYKQQNERTAGRSSWLSWAESSRIFNTIAKLTLKNLCFYNFYTPQ